MLRRLFTKGFHGPWICCRFMAVCVIKRTDTCFLTIKSVCHQPLHIYAFHLRAGSPVWKAALQPNRGKSDAIDLDKWKSVMKAKAVTEEKGTNDEQEACDDEELRRPGDDLQGMSVLEATRELVSMWRQAGRLVPQELTDEEVQTLADLATKSARKKYLKFLAIKEGHKRSRKEKQQQKKAGREVSVEQNKGEDIDTEDGDDQRGPQSKNTFLLQFWNRSLNKLEAWRCAQAMVFGQPLVFDMSYESNMSRREIENTVSQLMEVEGWNRHTNEPYHLHFCNLKPDGAYKQQLLKRYGAEAWDSLLITSTDRHHVDLFPREQLVYLTADSPNVLRTYDHTKVYIIGAMVDRSIQSGLSLANAKRQKLASARLPLDQFLHWEVGAKNLTLDQMIRIMMTLKETGKWEEAFKFVPKRKHDGFYQQHTFKEVTNNCVINHRPKEDRDKWLESGERKFRNEGQQLYRPYKQSGFTGRERMAGLPSAKPAATRVQTSIKNMEGRKSSGKTKMWWDDE